MYLELTVGRAFQGALRVPVIDSNELPEEMGRQSD